MTETGSVSPDRRCGQVDLDLGFTPSTNYSQLRWVSLAVGKGTDVPEVWLDVLAGTLTLLPPRYERRTESTYW